MTTCPCETDVDDPGPHIAGCPWNDPDYDGDIHERGEVARQRAAEQRQAERERARQRAEPGAPSPVPGFAIIDTGSRSRCPYLACSFATSDAAQRELASLLRGYPPRSEWRRRLQVVPLSELKPRQAAALKPSKDPSERAPRVEAVMVSRAQQPPSVVKRWAEKNRKRAEKRAAEKAEKAGKVRAA